MTIGIDREEAYRPILAQNARQRSTKNKENYWIGGSKKQKNSPNTLSERDRSLKFVGFVARKAHNQNTNPNDLCGLETQRNSCTNMETKL